MACNVHWTTTRDTALQHGSPNNASLQALCLVVWLAQSYPPHLSPRAIRPDLRRSNPSDISSCNIRGYHDYITHLLATVPRGTRRPRGQGALRNAWPWHCQCPSVGGGACYHDYYERWSLTLHPGKVPACHFSSMSLLTSDTILPYDIITT